VGRFKLDSQEGNMLLGPTIGSGGFRHAPSTQELVGEKKEV
jgi:hypothetical protein